MTSSVTLDNALAERISKMYSDRTIPAAIRQIVRDHLYLLEMAGTKNDGELLLLLRYMHSCTTDGGK